MRLCRGLGRLAACALAFTAVQAAPASAATDEAARSAALSVRAAHGLPADAGRDPALAAAAERVLTNGALPPSSLPRRISSLDTISLSNPEDLCGCEIDDGSGTPSHPSDEYARSTGRPASDSAFWATALGGGDLAATLGADLRDSALATALLDPRLDALEVVTGAGKLVVAARIDRSRPWASVIPVLAPGEAFDPEQARRARLLLLGPTTAQGGAIRLDFRSGGGWRTHHRCDCGWPFAARTGAGLVAVAAPLTWAADYRASWPGAAHGFLRTTPMSSAYLDPPFSFSGRWSSRDRAWVEGTVKQAHPRIRPLLLTIVPEIKFRRYRSQFTSFYSGGTLSLGSGHIRRRRSHVLIHEMAHAVQTLALDAAADRSITRRLKRFRRYRSCFRYQGSCLGFHEIWAEQFAYAGVVDRGFQSFYRVPRFASRGQLASIFSVIVPVPRSVAP